MSNWPRWSLQGEPLALAKYVLPGEVARYLQLPGRSADSRLTRLRAVYAAVAERGIGYAYDAPSDEAGRQTIRPPEQVLWAPRHATCLDLAVVLAGACLTAGLHPIIVVVDPPQNTGAGHALVLVRLDRDAPLPAVRSDSPNGDVWLAPPEGLLAGLQYTLDDGPPGDLVAVDPVGVAVSLGTARTRGLATNLAEAAANGASYLTAGDDPDGWTWRVGVDVGSGWRAQDTLHPAPCPASEPLREPYRRPETAESPLRLLRAEYAVVPFRNRDELTVLRNWCGQVAAGDRTGMAVIHGAGGAGKTRLALELADRMRAEGWYAGVLPPDPDGLAWLANVVSPVLAVLDYADGRGDDAKRLFKALRVRVRPAVVLLTARSIDGQWLSDIQRDLEGDRHAYRREVIPLPDQHPHPGDVYWGTIDALCRDAPNQPIAGEQSTPLLGRRWTTLDIVLLAWTAAHSGREALPTTRTDLYEEVLWHEENYWSTVYEQIDKNNQPDRALLSTAAACVSLVAPPEKAANQVLAALPDLANDPTLRRAVRRTLLACLSPAPGEGMALRPDPVGDYLVLRELGNDLGLLERILPPDDATWVESALRTLTRAGQQNEPTAVDLIMALIQTAPDRWRSALSMATAQAGAALTALEKLAAQPDTSLPVDELAAAIPFSSIVLFDLALQVELRGGGWRRHA